MERILNFAGFQLVWFACVLGAAHEQAWIGCAAALAFSAVSALRTASFARSASAFLVAGLAGSSIDALARALGWIVYAGASPSAIWAPVWILALWVAFAATFSSSLAWLRGRPWLSVPFVALGAPLSYLGAERLGAVTLGTPRSIALLGSGIAWIAGWHGAQWIEMRMKTVAPLRVSRWAFTALVLSSVLAVASTVGCTSMNKNSLATRLIALEKNAPVRAAGLQSRDAEVVLAGEPTRASYRYHRAGEPGRPVIVLVHGTPSSLFTWTELVHGNSSFAGLARDFEVYALDVLGHAATTTEIDRYSFQACADWVSGFLDALDLHDVTLVGQSYGGEFAWRSALDRRNRVARLVLISSSGITRRDDEWLPEEVKMREWSVARWGWLVHSRKRIAGAVQPHFQEPVPTERLEEYYLACANSDNWSAMVDLVRDENGSRSEELALLETPVLLVWGALDIAYRPERFAQEFARRLPRERLVLIDDAGHYAHEERPSDVAREVRAFVAATP